MSTSSLTTISYRFDVVTMVHFAIHPTTGELD